MARSSGEIARTVLWTGLFNMLWVGCLLVGLNWQEIRGTALDALRLRETVITPSADPIAAARVLRQDNEMLARGVQSSLKSSLAMTRALPTEAEGGLQVAALLDGGEAIEGDSAGVSPEAASYGPETPGGGTKSKPIAPILYKDKKTGQLSIGNFKSLSFVGDTTECVDMGYSMLGDAGTSNDVLDVLTATDAITIAKICASNGSVIISCRNDQIVISPRRSRPDDKCT